MDLLSPWNLIFLLPALMALLYLLMLATGTVSAELGDVDVDAEVGVDVDHGIEHAIGGGDGDQQSGSGGAASVLGILGIGRAPLSLILMSFCFLWGFFGWAGNLIFGAWIENDAVAFLPSLVITLVGATLLTRGIAIGLSRVLPSVETYATSNRGLVGRLASVRYAVTEQGGAAQLYNERGVLLEVPVRVRSGEPPIPSGREVILWTYDEAAGVFLVTHDPDLQPVDSR